MSFLITPVPSDPELREHVVRRESIFALNKIAVIEAEGVLRNDRPSSLLGGTGENPVVVFKEKLDKAASDPHVRAIVLRINSPGGGVTASDIMHSELVAFRRRTGKPVVASMLDIAASGGYYIACAADRIYAQPTTVTGSIGVIMLTPEFTGTMQKLGIEVNVIKSGELKDAGSPFRDMEPQDRAVFEKIIMTMYERFLDVVLAGRPQLTPERLRELADGRVYLAPDAQEQGLVDEIGSLDDAIACAKLRAGLGKSPVLVVQYAVSHAHRPNIYAETPGTGNTQVNLIHISAPELFSGSTPQFLYMWSPGLD
jgi:protease-4